MKQLLLSAGWQLKTRNPALPLDADFRERDSGDWLPAAVPGTVHEALWAAGRIDSPYLARKQRSLAWIGESEFLYRCSFDLPADFRAAQNGAAARLVCDGLDTIATVWL